MPAVVSGERGVSRGGKDEEGVQEGLDTGEKEAGMIHCVYYPWPGSGATRGGRGAESSCSGARFLVASHDLTFLFMVSAAFAVALQYCSTDAVV